MLALKTFGGLSVEVEGVPASGAAQQRKTLALLALLAVAGRRGLSRDKLSAYLWPESDGEHARHLFNQACYSLRRDLQVPDLFLGSVEVRLNADVIKTDVGEFEDTLLRGDFARAVATYAGPFLDGFYLDNADEFERWVEAERSRLAQRVSETVGSLAAQAAAGGDGRAAVKWWRRLTELDRFSAQAALGLMRTLDDFGERAEAVECGLRYEAGVRRELGVEPSTDVTVLIQLLRNRTHEGVRRTPEQEIRVVGATVNQPGRLSPPRSIGSVTPRNRRLWAAALVVGPALIVVVYLALVTFTGRTVSSTSRAMLVVLPFQNLTGDVQQDYLGDGLTEEMITQLGRLDPERLGVIARTSAMQYRNTTKRADQIGTELNVDYVLEGSVRRTGEQVVVSAHLVRVGDQSQVWSESFERSLSDIATVQRHVAQAIAREINLKLTPQQRARLTDARPVDPRAHEFYLKGRYFWNRRSEEGYTRAIHDFEQAIAVDSNYAEAYAGLADAYALLGSIPNVVLRRSEAMPRARLAALKALALDDELAEAHTSLAFVRMHFDWDWRGAQQEFTRAIELNPGYATAHHWYAYWLIAQGQADDALREIRVAQQLDPLSLVITADVGEILLFGRRYDESIAQARRTLDMDSGFALARITLNAAQIGKGEFGSAIRDLEAAARASNYRADVLLMLGRAYASAGRKQEARHVLDQLKRAARRRPGMSHWIGTLLAVLGENDDALVWLEKAYQEHNGALILLKVAPEYDGLHADPRFQDLTRRVLGTNLGPLAPGIRR